MISSIFEQTFKANKNLNETLNKKVCVFAWNLKSRTEIVKLKKSQKENSSKKFFCSAI